jgi:hypothetical protein
VIAAHGRSECVAVGRAPGIERETLEVVLLGSFTDVAPTPAAMAVLERVMIDVCTTHRVDPGTIVGHRDVWPTRCPGDVLHGRLPEVRAAVTARLTRSVPAAS